MIDKLAPQILEFLRSVFPGTLESLGSYAGMTVAINTYTVGQNSDKQINRLEELYNENISALSWTLPSPSTAVNKRSGSSSIYGNSSSSSSSNIYSTFASSTSSNIFSSNLWGSKAVVSTSTSSAPAVLVCANCVPEDSQIRQLFLGTDKDKAADSTTLDSWKYSSKLVRCKMIIEFFPDTPSAYCNGGVDVIAVGNKSSENGRNGNGRDRGRLSVKEVKDAIDILQLVDRESDTATATATTSKIDKNDLSTSVSATPLSRLPLSEGQGLSLSIPRCEVISDIPIGIRLLNSIRLGGRERNAISLVGRGEGFQGTLREGKEISVRIQALDSSWVAHRLGNVGITGKNSFHFSSFHFSSFVFSSFVFSSFVFASFVFASFFFASFVFSSYNSSGPLSRTFRGAE